MRFDFRPFSYLPAMKIVFFCALSVLSRLGGVWAVYTEALECPFLFELPDGEDNGQLTGNEKCFLDCTRQSAYDMVCEDVDFVTLLKNARKIPQVNRDLNVFIWNSPKISELDAGTFGPMRIHLKLLSLMHLPGLTSFPMLKDLDSLQVLKIENAPNLRQFSPEILPANLTKLVVFQTAIQQLSVDLQEAQKLEKMKDFVFIKHTIQSVRKDFITIFPNLATAIFTDNTFNLDSVGPRPFGAEKPYTMFVLRNNNFKGTPAPIQEKFFVALLDCLRLTDNGSLDLSYNGLPISKTAVNSFSNIKNIAHLSLAGNTFGQFFKAADMFSVFTSLKRLDLSHSSVPTQKGVFSGLDQLDQLVLRGNNFRNLNRVDIFEGFKGSLQRLDLSDNMLMNLPSGSLLSITSSLTELILAGNIFHTDLLDADDFEAMPSPVPEKYNFTNLRILDLSRTQLKTFKGIWIAKLTKLIRLDISCNNFKQVSKSFFTSLPSTLQKLNMSFCVSTLPDAPRIDLDAFSTIGGDNTTECNLDELILASGYLKGWIFFRLMALPNRTRAGLRTLDLSNNQIRYLEARHLKGFTELKHLNLGGNFIQTIGKRTFSDMTNLQSLNLSGNHIVSIQRDELVDINSLTFLDLSSNNLVDIGQGAFDFLPQLRELYLNQNGRIISLNSMFVTGGKNLVHLGIMNTGLTLTTYPSGCINRTDLDPMRNLKYFYIDNSTAVYVDHGTDIGSWQDKIKGTQLLPVDPYALQCAFGNRLTNPVIDRDAILPDLEPGGSAEWTDDFARLLIRNPYDLSPRTFVAHIPKCYSDAFKWVANSTSAFLCPNLDDKTFIPTPAPPTAS